MKTYKIIEIRKDKTPGQYKTLKKGLTKKQAIIIIEKDMRENSKAEKYIKAIAKET